MNNICLLYVPTNPTVWFTLEKQLPVNYKLDSINSSLLLPSSCVFSTFRSKGTVINHFQMCYLNVQEHQGPLQGISLIIKSRLDFCCSGTPLLLTVNNWKAGMGEWNNWTTGSTRLCSGSKGKQTRRVLGLPWLSTCGQFSGTVQESLMRRYRLRFRKAKTAKICGTVNRREKSYKKNSRNVHRCSSFESFRLNSSLVRERWTSSLWLAQNNCWGKNISEQL